MIEVVDGPTAVVHPINGPVLLTLYDGIKNSEQIAEQLGLDRRTVSSALSELAQYNVVKKGYRVIDKRPGRPYQMEQYWMIDDDGYREVQLEIYRRTKGLKENDSPVS